MYTLGLTGGLDPVYESVFNFEGDLLHDSAAVLLRDHEVIAGIEEERLNRIKHTNKFGSSAVAFCLNQAGITLADVDSIAIYWSEAFVERSQKYLRLARPELPIPSDARVAYQRLFEREFNHRVPPEKFHFVHHHLAHAATAYYMSGFDHCLLLTIDGTGDDVATMVLDARNKAFGELMVKPTEHSLGLFYQDIIRFLGYRAFDEYKVMGLAPYGRSDRYWPVFQNFFTLLPHGDYNLHRESIYALYDVLTPRKRGEPFSQIHMDIAAALQKALEAIVFHILGHFREVSGHERLAIAGGVGQNSSLNGKILHSGLFQEVFSPSFAGDSGCAFGAAMKVAHDQKPRLPLKQVDHAYWGTPLPNTDEVERRLRAWSDFVEIEHMAETCEQVSELLAAGSVVGWVQGRSEFGPRALGNRSIIADPRVATHKETINGMIKKRESYRPFAPSVLEDYVVDFFELKDGAGLFPFMAFVLPVKEDKVDLLPAITHVDGTARVQTVSKEHNEKYWLLIDAFFRKTGIPILLNTSFNNNAEPIVDSIDDAVVCYLTSGLDYLVVGDYQVRKRNLTDEQLRNLKLALPKAVKVIQEHAYTDTEIRDRSTFFTWNHNSSKRMKVSDAWYRIIPMADGRTSIQGLIDKLSLSDQEQIKIMKELQDLWSDRMILLHPVRAG